MTVMTIAGVPATLTTLAAHQLRALRVHRLAGLFPPVEGEDRRRLYASMRKGYDASCPLIVWAATGELVDGRNRRDIAVAALHLSGLPVAFVEFASEQAVLDFIIQANLARRHLTSEQRRALAGKLVLNGVSTHLAAKQVGVSQSTARREAAALRAGESSDLPAERTTGADGKSYPATRPQRGKAVSPTPAHLTGTLRRAVRAVEKAQEELLQLRDGVPLTADVREAVERLADRAAELRQALTAAEAQSAVADQEVASAA